MMKRNRRLLPPLYRSQNRLNDVVGKECVEEDMGDLDW